MLTVRTTSRAETLKLAKAFGETMPRNGRGVFVIALKGDLGAGKTTFVKGLARGLGIKNKITSPTFLMTRKYKLPRNKTRRCFFYHIDAYRMEERSDMEATGAESALRGNDALIIAVEWPERLKKLLPKKTFWIIIRHGKGDERIFSFKRG